MSTPIREFRFGNFVASLIWLIFIILAVVALVGLPLIFIILFYLPLPPVGNEVLTPYLFLSMMVDPTRSIPIIKFLIHTDLFRVAVFPGFTYAALIGSGYNLCGTQILSKDAAQGRAALRW